MKYNNLLLYFLQGGLVTTSQDEDKYNLYMNMYFTSRKLLKLARKEYLEYMEEERNDKS